MTASQRKRHEQDEDAVLALLAAAPVDDEPVTDDDRQHIAEGWRAYWDGQAVSAEDIRLACRGDTSDEDLMTPPRKVAV